MVEKNPTAHIAQWGPTLTMEGKMRNQNEIFTEIKEIIPANLWEKYNHLSFNEMAEVDELKEWADELRQAEKEWFETEE